jgi:hypothetical protein
VPEAAVAAVGDTLREQGLAAPAVGGGTTFLQAKTANEVLKAQERRIRLQKLKGELVDRARAETLMFRLAREERDAWVNWPARVAALMAAELTAALGDGRGGGGADAEGPGSPCPRPARQPRRGPARASGDDEPVAFDGRAALLRAWSRGHPARPGPDGVGMGRPASLAARRAPRPSRGGTARRARPTCARSWTGCRPAIPTQRVVFMKAAQVGATEAGNNWIGFVIHHAPGPMLAVQPTVELAKRNSRQRIDPLIEESPELRERVKPARSRDAGNTMLSKEFAGGILIMTGANSAVGLRSTPARYIFLDEVDAYPASADEEGDPVTLAEARSLTFAHRRKVFLVSTPTIRGLSRIEREYEASDQRRFFVPCPHCGRCSG